MIGHEMPAVLHPVAHVLGEVRLQLAGLNYANDDPFGVSLSGVNLAVHSGEIIGIAGISGNGQQELAGLISGEVQGGAVRFLGQDVSRMGIAERRWMGFAFVSEERLGRGAGYVLVRQRFIDGAWSWAGQARLHLSRCSTRVYS